MRSYPRIATHHDLQRISLIIRHLRPSFFARSSRRGVLTTSPSASAHPAPVPIRTYKTDSFPAIPTCPPSRCACAAMPSGLDIDRERPLSDTVPPYAQHVIVRTGREDWGSRIEEEEESVEGTGVNFARSLRGLVGRGGKFFDPERPILVTNSSLPASFAPEYTSVHIFPQHLHVPRIGHRLQDHEAFVEQFLGSRSSLKQRMHTKKAIQKSEDKHDRTGFPIPQKVLVAHQQRLAYTRNTSPTVLICGHHSRDTRCGILGPILAAEFNSCVRGAGQPPADDEPSTGFVFKRFEPISQIRKSRIALISHIGGHAFAGNIVIYFPKLFKMASGKVSPLAGKGIWYGRVEPRHVQGIVEETIKRGRVITELLRGIHSPAVVISQPFLSIRPTVGISNV